MTMNACSEMCLLVAVCSCQLKLTVMAAVIQTYSSDCGWTRVPERPVSGLNGCCVIDLHLHQSTAAICEHLCIKRPDEWAEKGEDVKKEHLCPLAYCFSSLSSFILANPRLVCYTGAVSPMLTVSLCRILCYFLGCVLSWPWTSRQEGPRLQMWAAPAAAVTEQHIVLGVLGELRLQSEPVLCHHWTRLSAVTPVKRTCSVWPLCSLDHSSPPPPLWPWHSFETSQEFQKCVYCLLRYVFVFSYLF